MWRLEQTTGDTVVVQLVQNGKNISGTARTGIDRPVRASGNIDGSVFYLRIPWNSASIGVYRGTIGASGRIDGTTYDTGNPKSKATWFSTKVMVCADAPPVVSKPTPPAASNPAPATDLAAWIGHWDTTTAQGGHYELVLQQEGDSLVGLFQDLNGNPQYNGSLRGRVSGNVFRYTCIQRGTGTTSVGMFQIDTKGKVIDGSGVVHDASKTKFRWRGTKVK